MNNTTLACFFSKFIDNQLPSVNWLFLAEPPCVSIEQKLFKQFEVDAWSFNKNIIFLTSVVNNIPSLPPQPSSQKFADVLKTSLTNCTSKFLLSVCVLLFAACLPFLRLLQLANEKKTQNCKNPTSPPIIGFTCCSFLLRTFLGRNGQSSKNHD